MLLQHEAIFENRYIPIDILILISEIKWVPMTTMHDFKAENESFSGILLGNFLKLAKLPPFQKKIIGIFL